MRDPLGFGQLENVADLLSCYEFRLSIEPDAAALAAERAGAAELAAIGAALSLMQDATNRQLHRDDADFQFHMAITVAADNVYFATAMRALKDHVIAGMQFHGVSVKRETSGLSRVFSEHQAIFDAIAGNDPDGARGLMHRHLNSSRERLFDRRKSAV